MHAKYKSTWPSTTAVANQCLAYLSGRRKCHSTFESGDASGLAKYALWVLMVTPVDALSRFGFLILPPATLLEESNNPGPTP